MVVVSPVELRVDRVFCTAATGFFAGEMVFFALLAVLLILLLTGFTLAVRDGCGGGCFNDRVVDDDVDVTIAAALRVLMPLASELSEATEALRLRAAALAVAVPLVILLAMFVVALRCVVVAWPRVAVFGAGGAVTLLFWLLLVGLGNCDGCRLGGDRGATAGVEVTNDVRLYLAGLRAATGRDGLTFGVALGVVSGVRRPVSGVAGLRGATAPVFGIVLRRPLSASTGDGNAASVRFNALATRFKCSTRRVGLLI